MEIEAFASHHKEQAVVNAPADLVFEYLDDFVQLGAHMTRSSWMMAGSKMSSGTGGGLAIRPCRAAWWS